MRSLGTTSSASDLPHSTAEAAATDLEYFLCAVLGGKIEEDLALRLQGLGTRELRRLADGVVLWTTVRGAKPTYPSTPDVLRWLFPERFAA